MKLKKGESIVTAWAEYCSGPGWSNAPIWVIVRDANKGLREECIQPEDQTPEMLWLFATCASANRSMVAAVNARRLKGKERKDV